ncbi:MAG: phosphoribosylanthranilate isomerase [Acetatifactor sp.]|nr:phosphoribosylanthranilate isomerase [Acetatifactor sp.]
MMNETKIKLCGMFRPEDIGYVNEVQPDYVGFVLAEGFRRRILKEQAADFRKALDQAIPAVGVFVNNSCEEVISFLQEDIIQLAQLHGNETEEDIQYIQAVTGKPVMKAVKVTSRYDVEAWLDSSADYLLFDGGTGSGVAFDWSVLADIDRDFFLAGGLNAGNLMTAVERIHPYAVDLSSGVETDGVKDLKKMREVVKLVRECRYP